MRLFLLAMLAVLASCTSRDLPNDLRYVELSSGNSAIIRPNGDLVVYPNVIDYDVKGHLVVGQRELATDNTDYSEPFMQGIGYFILDTRTGELRQGLDAETVAKVR